jgi:hypothetical protein
VKVRYQADADFDKRIVRAVKRREATIDFQSASEARSGLGLDGVPDERVLAICVEEGRILVTHDRRTMPTHFANFIVNAASPGVLIISQKMPLNVAVEHLVTIWGASEAEEWINQITPLK